VLVAIFNGKFQAINGRISETVRDRAKLRLLLITNRKSHTTFQIK